MASFSAFLEVKGNRYPLLGYDLSIHQETDSLGRPASPTLGGTIDCVLSSPGSDQPFLHQWMFSPTLQEDGKLVLMQDSPKATLKTISFFNAYCTGLQTNFVPGNTGGGSLQMQVRISPQRIAVGAIIHDNNWPLVSHGAGETFAEIPVTPIAKAAPKAEEPSAFMEGLHGVLDVVGMIPVIGEVADAANAAIYLGEGRYGEAALAAAAMIPLAGNVVGAAKLARRGAKLMQKAAKLVPPKLLSKLDEGAALVQKVCKEDPIDVATGMMLTQHTDVELSGPIPFVWERIWFSASDHQGPLGYGWHHRYDMGLTLDEASGVVVLRNAEGRHVGFEMSSQPGQPVFDRTSGLTLYRPAPDDPVGMPWRIWHQSVQVWYIFAQPPTNGAYQPLHAVANTQGQRIELSYEGDRLAQILDAASRRIILQYNEQGLLACLYGPDPDKPDQSVQLAGYRYNESGDLTDYTDAAGNRWQYRYEHHLMVQSTSPSGLSFYWQYDGLGTEAHCVHTWGDGNIHEGRFTYLDEQTTLFESIDGITRYTHREGLVTRETNPLGGESYWQYNEYNELVEETDPLGQTTRYGYNEGGNRIWTQYADGSQVQAKYDEYDRITAYTDQRDSTWQFIYNEQGLRQTQLNPLGAETRYDYDDRGRLITLINALGQRTHLRYDEQHQLIHVVAPDEEIRSRAYDALGRLTLLTDPTGAAQQRIYNLLGQLVTLIDSDGSQQQFTYDGEGNVLEARRGEELIEFAYTGTGRLAERRQAGHRMAFQYDREGRVVGLTNEADEQYQFELDALGQVITEIGFDGLTRRYERDAAGRVTRVLRPADRSTDYTYTEGGQIRAVLHSDGTQEVYSYDEAGAVVKAQNNTSTVWLERDALGQVVREEQGNGWVEYSYDALGQRTRIVSSKGADIQLTVDAGANVTQMRSGNWQAQFEYDQRGLTIQRVLSGGVRSQWNYDGLGRPVEQQISTPTGQDTWQRTYHWTELNQLTRIDDNTSGTTQFNYDPVGTLVGAHYADGKRDVRQADAVGNIFRSLDRNDRQYGPGGQIQQSVDGVRYRYDAEGNLTRKTLPDGSHWHYEWNGAGQLVAVKRSDGYRVSFTYDAFGRRLSKHFRGKATCWLWAGDKPLHEWAELSIGSGADGVEDVITWLFEEDGFAPLGKLQAGAAFSIVTDHLGTPLTMYNERGQATWSAELTSYGELRQQTGRAGDCPFRYQGQYEDVETGLYYNRFRYYDPLQGSYISQDPIRLLGGKSNLYAYVSNPMSWLDIFGLAELVYQLLNKAGDTIYYGITERTALERGQEHIKSGKVFDKMEVIAENLSHDQARTMEADLIRNRLEDRVGDYKVTDSIEEKLKKSGLLNKNRGRDIDVPGRRYTGKIPKLDTPTSVSGLKFPCGRVS